MIDPEKFENVPFYSLCGEHLLDAVDRYGEIKEGSGEFADYLRFRLDGKVYTALEDSNDDYRSSMEKLFVSEEDMKNVFPPVKVLVRINNKGDILELVDIENGRIILEVGTDHSDDYYPCFVASWRPHD